MLNFILTLDFNLIKSIIPITLKIVTFMLLLLIILDVAFNLKISFKTYVAITLLDILSTIITIYLSLKVLLNLTLNANLN